MNLIPNTLLSPLQSLFRNSRTVGFNFVPKDSEALNSLFRVMAAGFVSTRLHVHILYNEFYLSIFVARISNSNNSNNYNIN